MSRSNFRIKVDLSKYYKDIREFSCIFIDGTKILSISDMKKHITKLFNINEPYHLCLNNSIYLPPFEDARILKENETIYVIPGSGLDDEVGSVVNIVSPTVQDNYINNVKDNITCNHKEVQTIEYSVTEVTQIPTKEKEPLQTNELLSNFKDDVSSMDVTFHSIINDTEDNNSTDSKSMNVTVTDNDYMEKTQTCAKRKRVRHRKGKKNKDISNSIKDNNDDEIKTKKPKVVDSLVLSSRKHIRFDTDETDENLINQEYVIEPNTLSKLFELRNSSTPLTFRNQKIKEEMSTQRNISENEKDNTNDKENETLNNNNFEKNTSNKEIIHCVKNQTYSDVELEQYIPAKMHDIENLDVIAFKMLTMGKDYTPEISQMIIAQVIAWDKKSGSSTLKVIKGLDQIYDDNVPVGKFSLSDDDETNKKTSVILNLNYSKMFNPCIVKKLSANKLVS